MAVLSKDTTINNKKVLPLRHLARFVIGTSTSGHTLRDCDYLCNGIDDQVEINKAIQSLPTNGGEIIILDGTYNITAFINLNKSNVTISGNGSSTILKRMWDETGSNLRGVLEITSSSYIKVQNLAVDGNRTAYPSTNNVNIRFGAVNNSIITNNICYNGSISICPFNGTNVTVSNNICYNNGQYGIRCSGITSGVIQNNNCYNNSIYGIYLINIKKSSITGNTCNNNTSHGIFGGSTPIDLTISGNTCCSNGNNGIQLNGPSNTTILGNTCNNNTIHGICTFNKANNNTITGNTCNNNNDSGIRMDTASNTTISGNVCDNSTRGVSIVNCTNNTIVGNTCIRGTGLDSDYTGSQYTIYLQSSGNNYNLIAYNNIMGKNYISGGGTGNTFTNNKYD